MKKEFESIHLSGIRRSDLVVLEDLVKCKKEDGSYFDNKEQFYERGVFEHFDYCWWKANTPPCFVEYVPEDYLVVHPVKRSQTLNLQFLHQQGKKTMRLIKSRIVQGLRKFTAPENWVLATQF